MKTPFTIRLPAGLRALTLPAGLLALAALAVNLPWPSPEQLESFLGVYPWVVLVLGVLLGVRFRHGRVVFALIALALADWVLGSFPGGGARTEAARFAFSSTAFLLPLNLAWLAVARERGTLTTRGLLRLAVIAAELALVAFLWLSYNPGLVSLVDRRFLPAGVAAISRLPHPAVVAFALALAVTAVAWVRKRSFMASGFFWAVVGSVAALATSGPSTTMYLATAGLILVIALVESTFAMAYRDGLTGLPGRRAFDEALGKLPGRYAIAMVDIDHFKGVNDRYGHEVGDQVLRMVAAKISTIDGARGFRYGGEEFSLVFANRSRAEAEAQLEDLRARIELGDSGDGFSLRGANRPRKRPARLDTPSGGVAMLKLTVSIGVAERGGRLLKPEDVVRAADEALYRAKRGGRNRVST